MKILLVDDEPSFCAMADLTLKHLGHEVEAFSTIAEVLANQASGYELIIVDLGLTPDPLSGFRDGIELGTELYRRNAGATVILCSGQAVMDPLPPEISAQYLKPIKLTEVIADALKAKAQPAAA